jgi:hypothetical protein
MRRDKLGELDNLLAQLQMNDPHVGVEHAFHPVVLGAGDAKIGNLLELQHFREKVRLPVNIRNREADHFHAFHIARQTVPGMAGMPRHRQ